LARLSLSTTPLFLPAAAPGCALDWSDGICTDGSGDRRALVHDTRHCTVTLNGGVPNWLRMGNNVATPTFTIGTSTVTACNVMTATQIQGCTVTGTTTPSTQTSNVTTQRRNAYIRTGSGGSATTGSGKTITLVQRRTWRVQRG
jgi:hypothetical protein